MSNETVSQPHPVIIKIRRDPNTRGADEYPGWIVPDTNDLLAADMRVEAIPEYCEPASWVVTHLPTGMRVSYGLYTTASTREDAFALAQRFYRKAIELGCNLNSSDPDDVTRGFRKLSAEEKMKVWEEIAAWERDEAVSALQRSEQP